MQQLAVKQVTLILAVKSIFLLGTYAKSFAELVRF